MASLILGAFTAGDRSSPAVSALVATEGDERPGVLLELSGRRSGADATDSRWARLPGLVVRRGEPVSPFLEAGSFRAVWRGRLRIDTRDRYEFIAVGSGDVTLLVDGDLEFEGRITPEKTLSSKPRRLSKGLHDVEIRLSPRLGGRASFRLEWQSRRFGREPVPASNWVLPSAESGADWAAFAQSNRQRRAGSLLVAGRCGQCHEPPESQLEVLKPGGAKLRSAGLTEEWLSAWVLDPKSLDAETFMPRMLAGPEAGAEARDLAAFLARQGEVAPSLAGDASVGARLWADLGCFSCHDFSDPRTAGNWQDHNIPLGLVSAKYQLGGIAQFVQDPRSWRPGTAMPDFRLTEDEASDLEAFLRGAATLELQKVDAAVDGGVDAGDADRGRGLFESRNCRSCHALDAPETSTTQSGSSGTVAAKTLQEVLGTVTSDASCAKGSHGPGRPEYSFSATDLRAFGEFAEAGGLDAFERRVPEEEANRLLLQRRCIACHSIDGKTSQWSARIDRLESLGIAEHPERSGAAEDEVLQLRPDLSRAGEKLRSDWLHRFLDEATPTEPGVGVVRTWLRGRMPKLPADEARWLGEGLARMHGFDGDPEVFEPDPGKVTTGRTLVSVDGGFGCTSCHWIGEVGPTTAFEVLGVSLEHSAARLRPEYFQAWMHDPLRYEPASKMPQYVGDGGRTGLVQILNGDSIQQFDAIWHFLHGAQELR